MSLLDPQLEAFIAVARQKSVHGAAEVIHLTQTAVTQRIKALERRLHTTLFMRTRRGMLLTNEGEALLRYCHAVRALEGEALAQIQGTGVEADVEVVVTGPTSLMRSRVIPECLSLATQFPRLLFHFDVNDQSDRYESLRSGRCDFAILDEEEIAQEIQYKKLKPEEYVLVASSAWKDRPLEEILQRERIIDFSPSDQMTYKYLHHYHLFNFARHERHFVNRTESLAMMVVEKVGYTVLAKEFAKPFIESGELIMLHDGKPYNITPVLAWYDRPEPPAYFSAVIDAIE